MIRLETINEDTFGIVTKMQLSPEQNRFVAPNVVSLAQAWLYRDTARPYAVMNDDTVVGFLMLDWDEDERTAGIWRFMIATEHQRKGYGRRAIELAIQLARDCENIDMLYLDYVPGNDAARELYYSLGFRENGKVEYGEIVMTLPLTNEPRVGALPADADDLDDIREFLAAEQAVPAVFEDERALEDAVKSGRATRLTLMGETIGIALEGELLIKAESQPLLSQARERLRALAGRNKNN